MFSRLIKWQWPTLLLTFFLFGFLTTACVFQGETNEVSVETKRIVPHPEPVPKEAGIRITLGVEDKLVPILIVGLPQTVSGPGKIFIASNHQQIETVASAEGSFAAVIEAQGGDDLGIAFENSAPIYIPVRYIPGAGDPLPGLEVIPGVPQIVRNSSEEVRIQGRFPFEEKRAIIAVNLSSGAVKLGELNDQNIFQIDLPALSGDQIRVAADFEPVLGNAWHLFAP